MPILDWRELRNLVDMKQKGIDVGNADTSEIDAYKDWTEEDWKNFDTNLRATLSAGAAQRSANYQPSLDAYGKQMSELSQAAQEVDTGYGEYEPETIVPYQDWIKDPVNYRANAQSTAAKFWNGAAKLIPYAGTTFLDNTVGLVAGLLDLAVDADVSGVTKEGHSFVDTAFAEDMQKVRDWSEKILPNYRTTEEIEEQDQWWKHLNANFWGDTFLKNLGFTIGAGASGVAWSKGLTALKGKSISSAYKAAVAASVDGNAAAEEAFQRVLQGGAMQNPKRIYDAFREARLSYGKLSAQSMLIGSIGGAIGESRVEAMSAAKEFRDEYVAAAQEDYNRKESELEDYLLSKEEYLTSVPSYDEYGNYTGEQLALNEAGRTVLEQRLATIQNEYTQTMQAIDEQSDKIANTTFWLNMPLLTASNAVMFGRMYSGGFKSQAKTKIRGPFGSYKAADTVGGAVVKGLTNSLTEGMEELSQKVFSEGSKDIARANMAAFHNAAYDEDAIKSVSEWLMSMGESAGNVVTDATSWEEFAVGALTGALGMPTRFGFKNWSGGVLGGVQEVLERKKNSEELAGKLNKLATDDAFKQRWDAIVRHEYFERKKKEDLNKKDQFAWHEDNDAQLLSDVLAFADAGRLNDLEDIVDSFTNLSDAEALKLQGELISEGAQLDPSSSATDNTFANKTPAEIRDWVNKRAENAKETIQQYKDFHDSIDFLSLGTTDKEVVNEMIYTRAQLENFEKRYMELSDDVIAHIKPAVEAKAHEVDAQGNPTKDAKSAQELLSSEDNLRRLFGGYAIDTHGRSQTHQGMLADVLDDVRQEQVLGALESWGAFTADPQIKEQVSDLQKLIRARQEFYTKLFDPSFREKFEEQAATPQSTANNISAGAATNLRQENLNKLRAANNLKEFVEIFDSLQELADDQVDAFWQELEADPKLKGFQKQLNAADAFVQLIDTEVQDRAANPKDATHTENLAKLAEYIKDFDTWGVMRDKDDAMSMEEAVSRAIYDDSAGEPEQAEVLDILKKVLGDKALSISFGTLDPGSAASPAGDGSAGGTDGGNGTEESTGGSSTAPDSSTQGENPAAAPSAGGATDAGGSTESASPALDGGSTVGSIEAAAEEARRIAKAKTVMDKWLKDIADDGDINSTLLARLAAFDEENDKDLRDVAEPLDAEQKMNIILTAKARLAELAEAAGQLADNTSDPSGRAALGTDDKTEDEKNAAHADFVAMDTASINGTPFSVYDQNELRRGRRKPFRSTNEDTKATLQWMRAHKTQEFVDSGALAALVTAYAQSKGQLPIYFLANPHLLENNTHNNPFVTGYDAGNGKTGKAVQVMLAVEIDDAARNILKRYFSGNSTAGFITEDMLLDVEGKKYFVIGEMQNMSPEQIGKKPAAEQEAYRNVKKEAQRIWEFTVKDSIMKKYNDDAAKLGEGGIPVTGKWYVASWNYQSEDKKAADAEQQTKPTTRRRKKGVDAIADATNTTGGSRLFTTLHHIMSGRNETREVGSDAYERLPLSKTMGEYNALGKRRYFALVTKNDGIVTSKGAPVFPENAIHPAAGSLWMATQEANGKYAWTYVTINRAAEIDFSDKNNPFSKRLDEALAILFKPNDRTAEHAQRQANFQEKKEACDKLSDMFYLGKYNYIRFAYDNNNGLVLYVGGQRCIMYDSEGNKSFDAFRSHVVTALQNGNYRVSVTAEDVKADGYDAGISTDVLDNLIAAGALSSEMRSFIRMGASFGINFMTNDETVGVKPRPVSNEGDVARTAGEDTSSAFYRTADGTANIRISDKRYFLTPDGKVYNQRADGSQGDAVRSRATIAQVKALAELMSDPELKNKYAGEHWVVSDNKQYTDLFERTIDGITVHITRQGTNGAFTIMFDDKTWDGLLVKAKLDAALTSAVEQQEGGPQPASPEQASPADVNPVVTPRENAVPESDTTGENDEQNNDSGIGVSGGSRRGRRNGGKTAQTELREDDEEQTKDDCELH